MFCIFHRARTMLKMNTAAALHFTKFAIHLDADEVGFLLYELTCYSERAHSKHSSFYRQMNRMCL